MGKSVLDETAQRGHALTQPSAPSAKPGQARVTTEGQRDVSADTGRVLPGGRGAARHASTQGGGRGPRALLEVGELGCDLATPAKNKTKTGISLPETKILGERGPGNVEPGTQSKTEPTGPVVAGCPQVHRGADTPKHPSSVWCRTEPQRSGGSCRECWSGKGWR